jgi:hypothetical protein
MGEGGGVFNSWRISVGMGVWVFLGAMSSSRICSCIDLGVSDGFGLGSLRLVDEYIKGRTPKYNIAASATKKRTAKIINFCFCHIFCQHYSYIVYQKLWNQKRVIHSQRETLELQIMNAE